MDYRRIYFQLLLQCVGLLPIVMLNRRVVSGALEVVAVSGQLNFLRGKMNRYFAAVFLMLVIGTPTVSMLYCPRPGFAQQPSAKAYSPANVKAGEDVFLEKCFQCHSVNKGEVRVGPSLYGVMKGSHAVSAAKVRDQVTNGKGKMPPFKDLLTPDQVDHVIAYLHSL